MDFLLAVTAPIIYGGEYLYNRFIPAESILEIKGDINASDVIDGRQYLSYERCVDRDIVGTFVWELVDVERGLVRNYVVTAVIEQKDSCLINWELDQSKTYKQGHTIGRQLSLSTLAVHLKQYRLRVIF